MHEEPLIPHFWESNNKEYEKLFGNIELKEGQMICLEPILTYKDRVGYPTQNGWTWKTRDGKKACIFESQILVKKDGCEALTKHI